jgi:hypothetical protein
MRPLGTCTTDSTGLIVTLTRGRFFDPSWATLPFCIGGNGVEANATLQSVQSQRQVTLTGPIGPYLTPVAFAPTRETIYQAFYNKMTAGVPGLKTTKRRSLLFGDLPPEQQPALFIEEVGQNPESSQRGLKYKWELDVVLGLYVFNSDTDQVFPTMNPILDWIEATLPGDDPQSPGGNPQTLGGLVYWVRLTGDGKAYSGAKGGQGFAYLPARITTF